MENNPGAWTGACHICGWKKTEPQGEKGEKIPKLNVIDHRWNWQSAE